MGAIPAYKFLSYEEGKDAMTLHYVNDQGKPSSFSFGDADSEAEYIITGYSQSGRMYDGAPDHVVTVWLKGRGEDGVPIFGKIKASCYLAFTAPQDEATELGHALHLFMHGTSRVLKHLHRQEPDLKAITYHDGAFTLHYNHYHTLTIGVDDLHRRQLMKWGRTLNDDNEPGWIYFFFQDELGQPQDMVFKTPAYEGAMIATLETYLRENKRPCPRFKALYFEDDAITVEYRDTFGTTQWLTLGMVEGVYSHSLTSFGNNLMAIWHRGRPVLSFYFSDKEGQRLSLELHTSETELSEAWADLNAFKDAYPKAEAAVIPCYFLQAA